MFPKDFMFCLCILSCKTSKRTTRRPQTLAQTTYAMHHPQSQAPSSSPFTHAPLPHRGHTSTPPAHPPQHQPYPGYTYPYGAYSSYPGYTPYGQAKLATSASVAAKQQAVGATTKTAAEKAVVGASASGKEKEKEKEGTADSAEAGAWEAAQHILKAINFGSLQGNSSPASTSSNAQAATTSSSDIASGVDVNAEDDGLGRATLTDEERASLQAQLALLAAQLSEIVAEEDGDEDEDMAEDEGDAEVSAPPPPKPQTQPELGQLPEVSQTIVVISDGYRIPGPAAAAAAATTSVIVDVNQFPDDGEGFTLLASEATDVSMTIVPGSDVAAEDNDEDEDMEMVDVDNYMRTQGIRT